MISKIIQKEKERQEEYLRPGYGTCVNDESCDENGLCSDCMATQNNHKQSLINLKEYLKEMYEQVEELTDWIDVCKSDSEKTGEGKCVIIRRGYDSRDQLKEDIKELTKLIRRYK